MSPDAQCSGFLQLTKPFRTAQVARVTAREITAALLHGPGRKQASVNTSPSLAPGQKRGQVILAARIQNANSGIRSPIAGGFAGMYGSLGLAIGLGR